MPETGVQRFKFATISVNRAKNDWATDGFTEQ